MTQPAEKPRTFMEEVGAVPGGEGIRVCMQCGTCTASCPDALFMDHGPSELIALARAGFKQEVLSSNAMWYCLSCYLCTVRCPRDIKITRLMHIFESMADASGIAYKRTTTPVMYRGYNDFVQKTGRISELWLMMRYYLKTNPLKAVRMIPLAWNLFTHKRVTLKTSRISLEGVRQLNAITGKAGPHGDSK